MSVIIRGIATDDRLLYIVAFIGNKEKEGEDQHKLFVFRLTDGERLSSTDLSGLKTQKNSTRSWRDVLDQGPMKKIKDGVEIGGKPYTFPE